MSCSFYYLDRGFYSAGPGTFTLSRSQSWRSLSPFSSIRIVVRSVRSIYCSTFLPPSVAFTSHSYYFRSSLYGSYVPLTVRVRSLQLQPPLIILVLVPYMGHTHVPRLPFFLLTPKGMPYRSWVPWIVKGGAAVTFTQQGTWVVRHITNIILTK